MANYDAYSGALEFYDAIRGQLRTLVEQRELWISKMDTVRYQYHRLLTISL